MPGLRNGLLASALTLAALAPLASAHAAGFAVLYKFCSQANCTDGLWPYAGVISDKSGNLYGTTGAGGIASCRLYGCGTVFKLAPDGTETVLHAFSASKDGSGPYGGLIADAAGNLYGTTATGGSSGCGGISYGCGSVFEVESNGKEKILYAFGGNSDGAYPLAGLVADKDGNFYGTTSDGGGGSECIVQFGGCGTVFELAGGSEKVLYAFSGGSDGANPQASLIVDRRGNLFGTAAYGGNTAACNEGNSPGCGTVFEVTAGGKEKTLYSFGGGNDGWAPIGSLVEDKSGYLYGTTEAGGSTSACNGVGCGIVFRIDAKERTEKILYAFTGGSDGAHPAAGLLLDHKGDLYGTTSSGGASGEGTVFKLAAGGKLKVLNAFNGQGDAPVANLLAGANRTLYGTTEFGSDGTVFEVKK